MKFFTLTVTMLVVASISFALMVTPAVAFDDNRWELNDLANIRINFGKGVSENRVEYGGVVPSYFQMRERMLALSPKEKKTAATVAAVLGVIAVFAIVKKKNEEDCHQHFNQGHSHGFSCDHRH